MNIRASSTIRRGALVCALALTAVAPVFGQNADRPIRVTATDHAAARSAVVMHRKSHQVNGRVVIRDSDRSREGMSLAQVFASTADRNSGGGTTSGPRYMGDLHNFGGVTLTATQQHSIFMFGSSGCRSVAGCWGNPNTFLRDLGRSNFMHITDQYTGLHSDRRYSVGQSYTGTLTTPLAAPLTDEDVLAIVHSAAAASGQVGYGHMYNVHLAPGVDECFDASYSVCYSPDNFGTWYFCAYHGSVDFSDIGHVVYSVEPFQNVPGCAVDPGSPNGTLVDSTNSVLSHEVFEAITDPDGDGWWNYDNNGVYGEEIGDECSFLGDFGFSPSLVVLNEHQYAVQPEYNNSNHACTVTP